MQAKACRVCWLPQDHRGTCRPPDSLADHSQTIRRPFTDHSQTWQTIRRPGRPGRPLADLADLYEKYAALLVALLALTAVHVGMCVALNVPVHRRLAIVAMIGPAMMGLVLTTVQHVLTALALAFAIHWIVCVLCAGPVRPAARGVVASAVVTAVVVASAVIIMPDGRMQLGHVRGHVRM